MISNVRIRTQATAALTLARSLVSGAYALGRLSGFPLIPVYSEQSRRLPPSSADNRRIEFDKISFFELISLYLSVVEEIAGKRFASY
jgi:hypothetical protein